MNITNETRLRSYMGRRCVGGSNAMLLARDSEVGGVLGHSQSHTTYRYVNANVETVKRVAVALDAFNVETRETVTAPELVH